MDTVSADTSALGAEERLRRKPTARAVALLGRLALLLFDASAELPGVIRGRKRVGNAAFVGRSHARVSAVFSGIASVEWPRPERACGEWVIDITTGRNAAFLRFEDAAQALPRRNYAERVNDDPKGIAESDDLPPPAPADVPPALRRRGTPAPRGMAA